MVPPEPSDPIIGRPEHSKAEENNLKSNYEDDRDP